MAITKALVVDTPHVDRILSGQKNWELRTSGTKIRGRIALIRKGSGTVVGTVDIIDCVGPLSESVMLDNTAKHMVTPERIKSGEVAKYKHAWVLENAKALPMPVSYQHPSGAVIWLNLQPSVVSRLLA